MTRHVRNIVFSIGIYCFLVNVSIQCFFTKVIIWGHPLHSHTHSYIHWGFYRAFEHLGYEVYWVKNREELQGVDLHKALFITEGQVDALMPKRVDCYYILHNCDSEGYHELLSHNRVIVLQVYTHDCLMHSFEKIDDCIYGGYNQKIIFMPWATDLLPGEIDNAKRDLAIKRYHIINWVGTIGGGIFGNHDEIDGFKKACDENGIEFKRVINISMEHNMDLIKSSYMAPAIQGPYQCEKGYIPCRIFKNISYGQWGITNNKAVYDLFEGKIIYNPDTYQLFYDAEKHIQNAPISELCDLMDFVKNKHTYIQRIETLLTFMKRALNIKDENEVQ